MRTVAAHTVRVGDRIATPVSFVTVSESLDRTDLGYVRITHRISPVERAMFPSAAETVTDDVPTMTDVLLLEDGE